MQTEYGYSTTYYQYPTETMTSLVSPSVTFLLPHDWTINVSAAVGKDKTEFHAVGVMRATDAIYLNSSYRYGNKSRTYEIVAEGPLVSLPGADEEIAVAVGYSDNDFLNLHFGSLSVDGNKGECLYT